MPAWSPEERETVERLWHEGKSASQIAAVLPSKRSRNAVIGLWNRMGLKRAPEALREARRHGWRVHGNVHGRKPKAPRPKRPTSKDEGIIRRARFLAAQKPEPVPAVAEVPTTAKPWILREYGECAYPVAGTGADTFSCCQPVKDGKPYCAGHWRIMHAPKPAAELRRERRYIEHLVRRLA